MSQEIIEVAAFSATIFTVGFGGVALFDFIESRLKRRTDPPPILSDRQILPPPPPPPNPDPLWIVHKHMARQKEEEERKRAAEGLPISALEKLRDSCLTLFDKKPLKTIPPVFIKPDDHFSPNAGAHYEPSNNVICFNESSVKRGTPRYLADTMKHELLHAWIHQHDFKGDRHHDDLFKAAADLLGIEWREDYRES